MTYKIATFYQFVSLPDFLSFRQPLHQTGKALGLMGSILLAHEGINGTVSGNAKAIDAFIHQLQNGALGKAFDGLELKFSYAAENPFRRLKVRLKREIVAFGDRQVDPTQIVGTYVDAADWNDLIKTPGVVLIDTRNQFEVEMGTFEGAIDPKITRFSEFKNFVAQQLDPGEHKTVAMFCTGGIRCEKASSHMLAQGYETVYHLKGGILKYLEDIPPAESLWNGGCFVFDGRVALGHGLTTLPKDAPKP